MTRSMIGEWFAAALYLAMLGCGLYYIVFGQKLRDRHNSRNAAGVADGSPTRVKPPPDYFRLGLVLVIAGAGLIFLNFFH